MQATSWLPEPLEGTQVCLSFDGSETGDWTAIKAETVDGLLFTPRRPGRRDEPTIWDPAKGPAGRIPRPEVDAAVDWLFDRFDVRMMACDPPLWATEIDRWASRHGEKRVIRWETYRPATMHAATERFLVDLREGRLRHDGCPVTTQHIRNARMAHRKDGRYMLAKPADAGMVRKIDAAVASVLVHETAATERAAGWGQADDAHHFMFGL